MILTWKYFWHKTNLLIFGFYFSIKLSWASNLSPRLSVCRTSSPPGELIRIQFSDGASSMPGEKRVTSATLASIKCQETQEITISTTLLISKFWEVAMATNTTEKLIKIAQRKANSIIEIGLYCSFIEKNVIERLVV